MGIEENYAKLTKMILDAQSRFYRDNEKIDRKYLKNYDAIVEEPDDDTSGESDRPPDTTDDREAGEKSGADKPTP
jgi:hypothetical protein